MAILPHLEIGKFSNFSYSNDIKTTWVSQLKHSKCCDHTGNPISHMGGDQDYLDKNKHVYAEILKNGDEGVLNAARQVDSSIDSKIDYILDPKKLDDMRPTMARLPLLENSESKKSPLWKKVAAIGVLATASSIYGLMSYYDGDFELGGSNDTELINVFSDAAYVSLDANNPVERCLARNAVKEAVSTVHSYKDEGINSKVYLRDVWPEYLDELYVAADDCQEDHGMRTGDVTRKDLLKFSQSMHDTLYSELTNKP